MTWVAVNKDGIEIISGVEPIRCGERWDCDEEIYYGSEPDYINSSFAIPKGSIKKLIGRDITWENEPVELKEDE